MRSLVNRLAALESNVPVAPLEASADLMSRAYLKLGLAHTGPPHPGESFVAYVDRNPLESMLAVVRWGAHGSRP